MRTILLICLLSSTVLASEPTTRFKRMDRKQDINALNNEIITIHQEKLDIGGKAVSANNSDTVTNGVYTNTDQTISGKKTHTASVTCSSFTATNATITTVNITTATIAQPGWIAPTLLNSWENYGGEFSGAGYFKDSLGIVHLRGLVKSGIVSSNTPIFTLPANYLPAYTYLYAVESNQTHGRVAVHSNGDVICDFGSNNWVSLDGITFSTW